MSYRLDYKEEIPNVVARLREEHAEIDLKLERISQITSEEGGDLKVAVSLLEALKTQVLHHAVEEEARLARVVMESEITRKTSEESVKILQEHRRIEEFFKDQLPYLLDENSETQTKRKIREFVDFLVAHHVAEEQVLFPLSLKAASEMIIQQPSESEILFPETRPVQLRELINYQDGVIVSKVLHETKNGNLTLFAFDKDQGLSEHTSPFYALVQILEGDAEIFVSGKRSQASEGDIMILPVNQPHAINALSKFKMLLTMIHSH